MTRNEKNKYAKGWYVKNKTWHQAKMRIWHKNNRTLTRSHYLYRKYGITLLELEAMCKQQKNCCAICKKQFDRTPNVDHNHETGQIRGLLCYKCNPALGLLDDSCKVLRAAIKYLSHAKTKPPVIKVKKKRKRRNEHSTIL